MSNNTDMHVHLTHAELDFVLRYGEAHCLTTQAVMRCALAWLSVMHEVPAARVAAELATREHLFAHIGPKHLVDG